jgi:hypothetical protein
VAVRQRSACGSLKPPEEPDNFPVIPSARAVRIALLPLLIAAVLLVSGALVRGAVREGSDPGNSDAIALLTGGRILSSGSDCLYCENTQRREEASLLHLQADQQFLNPFTNAPLAAWALRPLSGLELRQATTVMIALSLVALGLAALMLLRLAPTQWDAQRRGWFLVATAGLLPAADAVVQWDFLMLLAGAAALLAVVRNKPLAAGLLLSVLLIKPQVVWLAVPLLLIGRHWRILGGLSAGALVWVGTGLLMVGPTQLAGWPRLILAHHVGEATSTVGIPGLVGAVTDSGQVAFVLSALIAVLLIPIAWAFRSELRRDPASAIALGIALSLLVAPHVWRHDLLLLGLPLALCAQRRLSSAVWAALFIDVAFVFDGVVPSALAHLETGAAIVVTIMVARRLKHTALEGRRVVPGEGRGGVALTRARATLGLVGSGDGG